MGYRTYITRAGYELQAKLFAEGGDFLVTKVEVGRGVCPEGTNPSMLTGLVERMAAATSTKPRREGCEVSLEVEYRSDLNGELETAFQINEFGVFALGVDGTEILLLYGDLSDYPETAVPQKYGGCVRRYPVNIIIGPDAEASLDYPAAAWMTCEEVDAALSTKQPLLAGQPGQVVGFDADGAAVAQDAPDLADAVTVPGGGVMELGPELGEGPYTFELEEDGETVVSAAQVSYDGTQSGLQAETVQGAVDELGARMARVSNKNLLHNWYFLDPVNQKGQTEYTEQSYGIDRWYCIGALSVGSGGVSLAHSGGGQIALLQFFENTRTITGETYTISTLFADGMFLSASGQVDREAAQDTLFCGAEADGIGIYLVSQAERGGIFGFNIVGVGTNSIQPVAAKLELGPIQTLAHKEGNVWVLNDPPPDKALELLKCQRYYQVFATQSLRPTKAEDFRPPMRTTPALETIVIDGVTYYTADANL